MDNKKFMKKPRADLREVYFLSGFLYNKESVISLKSGENDGTADQV